MNKKIIILIVVLIIILVIVAILLFNYLVPGKLPLPINLPREPEQPLTNEEIQSLFNDLVFQIENLDEVQIKEKLDRINKGLPFEYLSVSYDIENEVKLYLADQIRKRKDFSNMTEFKTALEHSIFSDFWKNIIKNKAEFLDINNYNYFISFKNQCSDYYRSFLTKPLTANPFDNEDNIINFVDIDEWHTGYPLIFQACKYSLDIDKCNNLIGTEIKLSLDPGQEEDEEVSYSYLCKDEVMGNLFGYFLFYSTIPCENIDFSKFVSQQVDSKCEYCQNLCKVFRREVTNLEQYLNMYNDEPKDLNHISHQAFLDKSLDTCDKNFNKPDEELDKTECRHMASQFLTQESIAKQDINPIDYDYVTFYEFLRFIIKNQQISNKLDEQITNNTYNFNFNQTDEMAQFCQDEFSRELEKMCINKNQEWFDKLKNSL